MKALKQNQVIKNSLHAFAKKDSIEELSSFSIECLDGLRNWIIQNKNNISEKKFEKALRIISAQICNADQTVQNPGFDYDKKWFCAQLRANGIYKLDKND